VIEIYVNLFFIYVFLCKRKLKIEGNVAIITNSNNHLGITSKNHSTEFMITSSLSHTFDQASWRIILEFVGIYGVTLNYSTIIKLRASDITDALRWSMAISPLFITTSKRHYIHHQNKTLWKKLLLKKVANGYKNLKFYEELEMKIENHNKRVEIERNTMDGYLRDICSADGWK
tara:strand:+ start:341 stop:862 length:522 start_codon:yes stop_codon:yes gene_type:complete